MTELFAPGCSITTTKRRRFFWAAWWNAPPTVTPFRKPDASDGGASTHEEALAAATRAAEGITLTLLDPAWARAWLRILRGQPPWPSVSCHPGAARRRAPSETGTTGPSIWALLGVTADATDDELKAAFRRRALATHPDRGGDAETFRKVVRAFQEAKRRRRRPKRKAD